jgi:hypothetical protein
MKHNPSSEANIRPRIQENHHVFVESEGPLACLHGPVPGPYPQPHETSPHSATLSLRQIVLSAQVCNKLPSMARS